LDSDIFPAPSLIGIVQSVINFFSMNWILQSTKSKIRISRLVIRNYNLFLMNCDLYNW